MRTHKQVATDFCNDIPDLLISVHLCQLETYCLSFPEQINYEHLVDVHLPNLHAKFGKNAVNSVLKGYFPKMYARIKAYLEKSA